jgi:nucleoside-diphosphate-sugar epimerase
MKVLYIGGTGEISMSCVQLGTALGQDVHVFNRGRNTEPLPPGVKSIIGDLTDAESYRSLGQQKWDVVCQFKAYTPAEVQRDLDVFAGNVGQYVFISSASAYQKPPTRYVITEDVPLANPYWAYSQAKADCEKLLFQAHADGKIPVTVVRPSHTYRRNIPTAVIGGDGIAWRIINRKPIIVHGDGSSLWTLTFADDFAKYFVRLLGHPKSLGQAFHITSHMKSHTWDQITHAIGSALGVEPEIVHVPTETLIRFKPDWAGPLLGDKAHSVLFDNTKIRSMVGAFTCDIDLAEGMKRAAEQTKKRLPTHKVDEPLHALADRIIAAQRGMGG